MASALRFGRREVWLVVALVLGVGLVLLLLLGVEPQLLKPSGKEGELKEFTDAVEDVRGPATIALASVGFVGVLAGGGLLAIGQRDGIRIMSMAAGALAGVLLGNGLIE